MMLNGGLVIRIDPRVAGGGGIVEEVQPQESTAACGSMSLWITSRPAWIRASGEDAVNGRVLPDWAFGQQRQDMADQCDPEFGRSWPEILVGALRGRPAGARIVGWPARSWRGVSWRASGAGVRSPSLAFGGSNDGPSHQSSAFPSTKLVDKNGCGSVPTSGTERRSAKASIRSSISESRNPTLRGPSRMGLSRGIFFACPARRDSRSGLRNK